MGEIISLTEAVRRYRIGEKTLLKWIRATKEAGSPIAEKKPNESKVKQWEIDTDKLEQLIREKRAGTLSPTPIPVQQLQSMVSSGVQTDREQITALAAELSYHSEIIEAMKTELEDLHTRVTALEQGSVTRSKRPAQRRITVEEVNYSVPARPTHDQDLPPGSITLAELAKELGINRTTLLGHVKNEANRLEHIAIEKPNRPGEYTRYFTPEQVTRVKEWHKEHTRGPQTLWDGEQS